MYRAVLLSYALQAAAHTTFRMILDVFHICFDAGKAVVAVEFLEQIGATVVGGNLCLNIGDIVFDASAPRDWFPMPIGAGGGEHLAQMLFLKSAAGNNF